jgi:hypothetical protein
MAKCVQDLEHRAYEKFHFSMPIRPCKS